MTNFRLSELDLKTKLPAEKPWPRAGVKPQTSPMTDDGQLLSSGIDPSRSGQSGLPSLSVEERVLVRVQNVHDYFVAHFQEHGWDNLKNFTCVKPPFPRLLFTYEHKFYAPDEDQKAQKDKPILRHMDVVLTSRSVDWFDYYLRPKSDPQSLDPQLAREHREELGRILLSVNPHELLEVRVAADGSQWPGKWFVMLDAAGSCQVFKNYGWVFIQSPEDREASSRMNLELLQESFSKHCSIALAAISFMNCRNVEVLDNPPTRQQRRQAERTGARPPVTYKTLRILPVTRPAKNDRGSGVPAGEVSLHICRGHFKDYRTGGGLGKGHRHGVWWWSPQVRGKLSRGRVVKDYEVKA